MPQRPDTGTATGTAAGLAGGALGLLLGGVAAVRRGKPLHPRGHVVRGTVVRTGCPERWGVPWLDEPGRDDAVVRFSHALGLPAGWPDVLGLALRFDGLGRDHDLLLATTGAGPLSRFALVPRVDLATATYGSLLPYASPRGPVLLAAVPTGWLDGAPAFGLEVAAARGPWQRFGLLRLDQDPVAAGDAHLDLDPVENPLPGLAPTGIHARLRSPAYRAARLVRPEPVP